ncbi:hypothetical protein K439DRAFT_1614105 [Ramaria rubella]|nr:hypothetical protein K439DRAFT_1614105 [Ramaria rubella]
MGTGRKTPLALHHIHISPPPPPPALSTPTSTPARSRGRQPEDDTRPRRPPGALPPGGRTLHPHLYPTSTSTSSTPPPPPPPPPLPLHHVSASQRTARDHMRPRRPPGGATGMAGGG